MRHTATDVVGTKLSAVALLVALPNSVAAAVRRCRILDEAVVLRRRQEVRKIAQHLPFGAARELVRSEGAGLRSKVVHNIRPLRVLGWLMRTTVLMVMLRADGVAELVPYCYDMIQAARRLR